MVGSGPRSPRGRGGGVERAPAAAAGSEAALGVGQHGAAAVGAARAKRPRCKQPPARLEAAPEPAGKRARNEAAAAPAVAEKALKSKKKPSEARAAAGGCAAGAALAATASMELESAQSSWAGGRGGRRARRSFEAEGGGWIDPDRCRATSFARVVAFRSTRSRLHSTAEEEPRSSFSDPADLTKHLTVFQPTNPPTHRRCGSRCRLRRRRGHRRRAPPLRSKAPQRVSRRVPMHTVFDSHCFGLCRSCGWLCCCNIGTGMMVRVYWRQPCAVCSDGVRVCACGSDLCVCGGIYTAYRGWRGLVFRLQLHTTPPIPRVICMCLWFHST